MTARGRARQRLVALGPRPGVRPTAGAVALAVAARVGRASRRSAPSVAPGRRRAVVDDRVRGAVVVLVVLGAAVVHPILGLLAVVTAVAPPAWHRRRVRRRQAEAVVDELPEIVELLHLAVSAGLNLHLALDVVVAHSTGRCTEALAAVCDRVQRGQRLADALDVLGELGPPARPLQDALVAAERHGTPVLAPLARVADEVRVRRRQRRDERARRLPVALLFPLVCCTLPALALVTVVPVVARPWLGSSP